MFKEEYDLFKEFPCKFTHFYVYFSKYNIRRVNSLWISFKYRTGLSKTLKYEFTDIFKFYDGKSNIDEDLLMHSIKTYYSNPENLN